VGIETMAAISIGSAVVGSGVSAMGASKTADANAAAYGYKAQVAANNAQIAEMNAREAVRSGATQGQNNDLKTRNLVGQQLVTQASNGLDVNSGSNVDVRQSAIDLGHLDTLTIINNAAKKAVGYKNQAGQFMAESQLNKMSAANAETEGEINVAKSLIGGASSVSDKWLSFNSKGVFA
jgi:hypothetical protein